MAIYRIDAGRRRSNRPAGLVQINWASPFAVGLIGATPSGVATDVELVSGRPMTRFGSPAMRATPWNQALDVSGGNDRGAFLSATPPMRSLTECTLVWWGYQLASASASSHYVGVTHNNAASAPFITATIGRAAASDLIQLNFNDGTTFRSFLTPLTVGASVSTLMCLIATIKNGSQVLYLNGVQFGSAGTVAVTTLAAGTTAEWCVGSDHFGAARNSGTLTVDARIYNRAISDTEALAMGSSPDTLLDLYQPPSTRVMFNIGPAFNPAWARNANHLITGVV